MRGIHNEQLLSRGSILYCMYVLLEGRQDWHVAINKTREREKKHIHWRQCFASPCSVFVAMIRVVRERENGMEYMDAMYEHAMQREAVANKSTTTEQYPLQRVHARTHHITNHFPDIKHTLKYTMDSVGGRGGGKGGEKEQEKKSNSFIEINQSYCTLPSIIDCYLASTSEQPTTNKLSVLSYTHLSIYNNYTTILPPTSSTHPSIILFLFVKHHSSKEKGKKETVVLLGAAAIFAKNK